MIIVPKAVDMLRLGPLSPPVTTMKRRQTPSRPPLATPRYSLALILWVYGQLICVYSWRELMLLPLTSCSPVIAQETSSSRNSITCTSIHIVCIRLKKIIFSCHNNATESHYFVLNQIWKPSLEGAPTQFKPVGLISPSPSHSTQAVSKLRHILGMPSHSVCQVISLPSSK